MTRHDPTNHDPTNHDPTGHDPGAAAPVVRRGPVQRLFAAALEGDRDAETRLRDRALVDPVAEAAHAALLECDLRAYLAAPPQDTEPIPTHVLDQILAIVRDPANHPPQP